MPWIYWLSVVFLSVIGTLITDNMSDNLGISLYVSTALFAVLLAVTFIAWYRSERTLSIHAVTTRRRELYYWATWCPSNSGWATCSPGRSSAG